jgi:hypothetical protein
MSASVHLRTTNEIPAPIDQWEPFFYPLMRTLLLPTNENPSSTHQWEPHANHLTLFLLKTANEDHTWVYKWEPFCGPPIRSLLHPQIKSLLNVPLKLLYYSSPPMGYLSRSTNERRYFRPVISLPTLGTQSELSGLLRYNIWLIKPWSHC